MYIFFLNKGWFYRAEEILQVKQTTGEEKKYPKILWIRIESFLKGFCYISGKAQFSNQELRGYSV